MADVRLEKSRKDSEIRDMIHQKLEESGEKRKLQEFLRRRLEETKWRDDLKRKAKEIIKEKGMEKVRVEDLVAELTQHGRATVPSEVKSELLEKIRLFLATE
eukprot:TRINITY_DN713_c0_g4_i2.p2 TRINITY_DN713_c0_g4~~TRINITY_DN713_c0_g4_i2.p2  ORF type:complete len:102 (+),score=35.50 TRINITY_DN713_c0_g4_i2:86-391(+)